MEAAIGGQLEVVEKIMKTKIACGAFVSVFCLAAGAAHASCDDRPGTPNNITMTGISPTSVEVSWRNTTFKGMNPSGSTSSDPTHKMWFDMYFRNGTNGNIGRDLTGTGPYDVNYGMVSKKTFDGLAPSTRYCFSLRARTEGGTQGCISAVTSGVACASTLAPGQKPAPVAMPTPPKGNVAPSLSIEGKPNNTVVLTGAGFQPSASVTIRAVNRQLNQIWVTSIGGAPIKTSSSGSLSVTLQGFCKTQGDRVTFTATDGRADPSDKVMGKLFSNPVSVDCN